MCRPGARSALPRDAAIHPSIHQAGISRWPCPSSRNLDLLPPAHQGATAPRMPHHSGTTHLGIGDSPPASVRVGTGPVASWVRPTPLHRAPPPGAAFVRAQQRRETSCWASASARADGIRRLLRERFAESGNAARRERVGGRSLSLDRSCESAAFVRSVTLGEQIRCLRIVPVPDESTCWSADRVLHAWGCGVTCIFLPAYN